MLYFVYLLFFFTTSIQAVLEKVRILTNSSHKIIIFFDDHKDYPQADEQQLECFTQGLCDRDKKKLHPLHVLIEEPIVLSKLACTPKVTTRLSQKMYDQKLCSVDLENIEIRKAAILAAMIMHSDDNPELFTPGYGEGEYTFGDVSFVDVLNECLHHFNRLQNRQQFIMNHIGYDCLKLILDDFFLHHDELINNLHALMINPAEPILNIAKKFYAMQQITCIDGTVVDYQKVRKVLLKRIIGLSGALLDFHIIDRVLTLPVTHDILIVTGSYHANVLSVSLTGWLKSRYNSLGVYENPVPCDTSSGCISEQNSEAIGLQAHHIWNVLQDDPRPFHNV